MEEQCNKNVEGDNEASINSDHNPVWARMCMKLKAQERKGGKKVCRERYGICNDDERKKMNETLSRGWKRGGNMLESKERLERIWKGLEEAREDSPKLQKKQKKIAFSEETKHIRRKRRSTE